MRKKSALRKKREKLQLAAEWLVFTGFGLALWAIVIAIIIDIVR